MSRRAQIAESEPLELSVDEWLDLPEDEAGELLNGCLEEEEAPDFVHEALVALLGQLFVGWALPRGGIVGGSEVKLVVDDRRGVKPDLVVYLPGSPMPPRRGRVRVPPDIVVEIISPRPRDLRRDRVAKINDYAALGVRFYWLVDPELRTLEILELGEDRRYVHALGASAGVLDKVPGCEGLSVDLDTLWSTVNRVDPASCPAGSPTDPDVRISRIRLLRPRLRCAAQMAWMIRGCGRG